MDPPWRKSTRWSDENGHLMRAIVHIVAVRGVLSYNRAAANRPLTRLRYRARQSLLQRRLLNRAGTPSSKADPSRRTYAGHAAILLVRALLLRLVGAQRRSKVFAPRAR